MDVAERGSRASRICWDDARRGHERAGRFWSIARTCSARDKRVTNYGGGNTSSKIDGDGSADRRDGRGAVGQGLGRRHRHSIKLDGFSTLYMDKLSALKALYRGVEHEDEMVGYLPHCTFNLNPRAASIDTPLHAYRAAPHVDHMHPDAIIAIAASQIAEELTQEIFGDDIGWLPWKRPGFELGLWLEEVLPRTSQGQGRHPRSHGLFTWGDTPKECYETTHRRHQPGDRLAAKQRRQAGLRRRAVKSAMPERAPRRRGEADAGDPRPDISKNGPSSSAISTTRRRCWNSSTSRDLRPLAALGTSCPDHFLRTKIRPLVHRFRSRQRRRSPICCRACPRRSKPTARTTPPITIAASGPIARPCATPTRWST